MITFDKIYSELAQEEGKVLKVYLDSKKIRTCGVGHNIEANPTAPIIGRAVTKLNSPITENECITLFRYDVSHTIEKLDIHLPWWRVVLCNARQYVLIDLCFNMGIGNKNHGLLSFVNTLAHIKSGRYEQAARGLLASKWAKDVRENRANKVTRILINGEF